MNDPRPVPLIAVVDSNRAQRVEALALLRVLYRVDEYPDAIRTIPGLRATRPRLVIVNEDASPFGGAELIEMMRRDQTLAKLTILFTTDLDADHAAAAARDCGADAGLPNAYRAGALLKTVSHLLNHRVEAAWTALPEPERVTLQGTVQVFDSITEAIDAGQPLDYGAVRHACAPLVTVISRHAFGSLLAGVKEHDNYTFAHSLKVATMLCLFGNTIGLNDSEQLLLACGGLLHDTGKMIIPLEVLNKAGRLDAEEWRVMQQHVPNTIHFLEVNDGVPKGALIIGAQHHEKLDGTGYPLGLKGSELNELARMAAIVDVFSALTDRRVYKPAMEAEQALGIMTNQMAPHLDQHYIRLFRTMLLDLVPRS